MKRGAGINKQIQHKASWVRKKIKQKLKSLGKKTHFNPKNHFVR